MMLVKYLTGIAPIDQNPNNDPAIWNWAKNTAKAPLPPDPPPAPPATP